MRLEGASEPIHGAVPNEYLDVVVAITDLGSPTVMLFLLAILYWVVDRDRALLVVGYAFVGLLVLVTLKAALGMPRPPDALFLIELDADEYGFPSGHTYAAVVVYGGLLVAFDRTRSLPAVGAVTTLVVAIGLSRVILGLHYLGDVVAGGLFGALTLVILERVVGDEPRRAFAITLGCSLPAVLVVGFTGYTLLGIGGGIGGVLAASRLESLPSLRGRLEGVVLVAVGCGFVLALEVAIDAVPAGASGPAVVAGLAAVAGLYAVQVAGIILAPAAVGRLPLSLDAGPDGSPTADGEA